MVGKLTKRTIDAVECGAADTLLWDSELKGFGLKVTPKGRRVFVVQYRARIGARGRRRVTLGTYGALTVDQARDAAARLLGRVAGGDDPAADASERRRAAKEATVALVSAEYLEDMQAKAKPRTVAEYARLFNVYISPTLGQKPVADVSLQDVSALHSAHRKHPYQANRILNLLGAFLHWGETRGYRPRHSNPCADVARYPEHSRERFLSPAEVGALGAVLVRAEREGLPAAPSMKRKPKRPETAKHRPKSADAPIPANPFAVAAIRFLLLTGWREQEVLTLRWADVDMERGAATLPDTKTGKSHRAIGAPAVALIASLQRFKGSPYVFPGAKPGMPLREIRRVWTASRHAAGLDDVRLHDLRHTMASFAVGSGHSLYLTGKLLGHARAETTQRYAHLADDARKVAADEVAGEIAAALDGTQPARVLPLRSGNRARAAKR